MAFEDMNYVQPKRCRLRLPTLSRSRHLDGSRSEAQLCDSVSSSGMALALGARNVRARRERDFRLQGDFGRSSCVSQSCLLLADEDTVLKRANDEAAIRLAECREQGIRIRLSIHDVDRLGLPFK